MPELRMRGSEVRVNLALEKYIYKNPENNHHKHIKSREFKDERKLKLSVDQNSPSSVAVKNGHDGPPYFILSPSTE
jgi:hypothetical protein